MPRAEGMGLGWGAVYLTRPPIVLLSAGVSYRAFGGPPTSSGAFALGGFCLMLMSGYALNDVLDIRIDATNAPHRPLPSGVVSLESARILVVALLGFSLVAALLSCSLWMFAYCLAYWLLFVAYSRYLSRIWWIKNPITALSFATAALWPTMLTHSFQQVQLPLFECVALFTFGRELIMDVRDQTGDAQSRISLAARHGRWIVAIGTILMAVGMLWTIGLRGRTSLAPLTAAVAAGLLWFGTRNMPSRMLWRYSEAVKLAMILLVWAP